MVEKLSKKNVKNKNRANTILITTRKTLSNRVVKTNERSPLEYRKLIIKKFFDTNRGYYFIYVRVYQMKRDRT